MSIGEHGAELDGIMSRSSVREVEVRAAQRDITPTVETLVAQYGKGIAIDALYRAIEKLNNSTREH